MKVRHKLQVLMAKRNIRSIKQLSRELPQWDYATLYHFSSYKHKKLDPKLISDLCEYFGCSIGDLLYLEESRKEGA